MKIGMRSAFAFVNNLYCIPAHVIWMMALRLLKPLFPTLYWKMEGLLYHWLLAMVSMWSWTAGYEIYESGEDPAVCYGRRTLILANHQSTGDVPMLMAAWNPRPGVLPNLMWIMDRVFKFTNFGIVSLLHEDFFIQAYWADLKHKSKSRLVKRRRDTLRTGGGLSRLDDLSEIDQKILAVIGEQVVFGDVEHRVPPFGRNTRDKSLEELRQHLHNSFIPRERQFMVLFPEGGFLRKRREISQRFAEKNNLPRLENVTLPRAGAMKVIMEEMGPYSGSSKSDFSKDNNFNQNSNQADSLFSNSVSSDKIEWILDVTIAYSEKNPIHLYDVVCGLRDPCPTNLHYRLYRSTDVPSDSEGMTNWLYDRFVEKDKLLHNFYETGSFTPKTPTSPPRRVRQDDLRFIILHIFFILSTYIHYKIIMACYAYLF